MHRLIMAQNCDVFLSKFCTHLVLVKDPKNERCEFAGVTLREELLVDFDEAQFRQQSIWTVLEETLVPETYKRKLRAISCWSASTSSAENIYSNQVEFTEGLCLLFDVIRFALERHVQLIGLNNVIGDVKFSLMSCMRDKCFINAVGILR